MADYSQIIFRILLLILLVTQTSFVLPTTFAQGSGSDREAGIALYERKEYQQSSQALERAVTIWKDDLAAWHYLGLALEELSLNKDAINAHQKAAKLGSSLVISTMKGRANWLSGLSRDNAQLIHAAAVSADRYIKLSSPKNSQLDEWSERAMSLRELAEFASSDGLLINLYTGKEVQTKAHVLDVPAPEYGPENQMPPTTVVLRGIFTADGHVRGIFPLDSDQFQGYGVACIKAARKIRFTPALKDGKPVSMYMEFQYNFNR
jgi:tetratricopeptide (TPR) repeat protein